MEHRWGERITINVQVLVESASKSRFRGTAANVSSSGLFVRSVLAPAVGGAVFVELDDPRLRRTHRVPAHVVRQTEAGIGLEWDEFAPRPIGKLLTLLRIADVSTTSSAGGASRPSRRWALDARAESALTG